MKGLINKLASLKRAKYDQSETESIFFETFICLFLNTALIPFLVMFKIDI